MGFNSGFKGLNQKNTDNINSTPSNLFGWNGVSKCPWNIHNRRK